MNSIVFITVLASLCQALAEDTEGAHTRVPRTLLLKKKLCFILGVCGGGGGHYGGSGHYNGGHGYQNQGYPPINIGISQSQSSANAGGGGLGAGYYPNNYQYNGGYPGYNSYGRPGYFGNGYGGINNQFNGNYNGGNRNPGYGYRGPFGSYYDEGDSKPIYEDTNEDGPIYDGYDREDRSEAYRNNQ